MEVQIEKSRKDLLQSEFEKDYFLWIKKFLSQEIKEWKTIYPKWKDIFNAFNSTPVEKVKVVILWQDPYHWPNQAHWLSFSVQEWIKQPPSLKNIFKELQSDLWIQIPSHWCLQSRAEQWILMLNASLTVRQSEPMSHSKIGWEIFTDSIIQKLSDQKEGIIFVLWWAFAQSKENLIDSQKHYILKSAHPSPFSAHRWFFGTKPFSKINQILSQNWKSEINRKI